MDRVTPRTVLVLALVVSGVAIGAASAATLELKESTTIDVTDVPGTITVNVSAQDGVPSSIKIYENASGNLNLYTTREVSGSATITVDVIDAKSYEVRLWSDQNHSATMTASYQPDADATATATATATETTTTTTGDTTTITTDTPISGGGAVLSPAYSVSPLQVIVVLALVLVALVILS